MAKDRKFPHGIIADHVYNLNVHQSEVDEVVKKIYRDLQDNGWCIVDRQLDMGAVWNE